jgi:hypothetical protein
MVFSGYWRPSPPIVKSRGWGWLMEDEWALSVRLASETCSAVGRRLSLRVEAVLLLSG